VCPQGDQFSFAIKAADGTLVKKCAADCLRMPVASKNSAQSGGTWRSLLRFRLKVN
jgi:hypothetical protein